jgi:hypothetical protein
MRFRKDQDARRPVGTELKSRRIDHRELARLSYAPLDLLKSDQALQGVYVLDPY